MARFLARDACAAPISLDEYIAYCDEHLAPDDEDNIFAGAAMLQALALDRRMLVDKLNDYFRQDDELNDLSTYSSMTMMLALRPKYFIRANTWVRPRAYAADDAWENTLYAYDYAHNHNFSLLTVGYHGPGYRTDIYRLDDPSAITGYEGEKVSLAYEGRYQLGRGDVLLYERVRDVHVQLPPDGLSISLNLMPLDSRLCLTEQFSFDVQAGTIASLVGSQVAQQSDLLRMAACVGDGDTAELLLRLARRHSNQSTRLAAMQSAVMLLPSEAEKIWEIGLDDKSEIVRQAARGAVLSTTSPMAL
ncbi:MAG TPA: hypothetical protein VF453_21340 [Burkholderiaceae bacterium]